MATMGELPSDLLYCIILLLVQSPGGVADFARMVSVCRKFRLFTQKKHILSLVSFDMKLEFKNFIQYQHINSLLVKCSEAGNIAAQFLLGKVILVSSSQLFLGEWQKAEFHPCDSATLGELRCILATNDPGHDYKVGSFMAYFLPEQVHNSEVSRRRLVHYQLVKVFLLNGSLHDLAEMAVFIKCYIKFFTSVTEEDDPLLATVNDMILHADTIMKSEKALMELSSLRAGCERCSNAIRNCINHRDIHIAKFRGLAMRFFETNWG
ncbi:uncharacterized protein LOC141716657 isoform X2 [Apium graveolens]